MTGHRRAKRRAWVSRREKRAWRWALIRAAVDAMHVRAWDAAVKNLEGHQWVVPNVALMDDSQIPPYSLGTFR